MNRTVRIGITGKMIAEYQRRDVFPMLRFDQAKEVVQNKVRFDVSLEVARDIVSDAARERLQSAGHLKRGYTCLLYDMQRQLGLPSDRERILDETAPAHRASNVIPFRMKPDGIRRQQGVEQIFEAVQRARKGRRYSKQDNMEFARGLQREREIEQHETPEQSMARRQRALAEILGPEGAAELLGKVRSAYAKLQAERRDQT